MIQELLASIPTEVLAVIIIVVVILALVALVKKAFKIGLFILIAALLMGVITLPASIVQGQYGISFRDSQIILAVNEEEYALTIDTVESINIEYKEDENATVDIDFRVGKDLEIELPEPAARVVESLANTLKIQVTSLPEE